MTINVLPETISAVAEVETPILNAQAEAEEDARRSSPMNAYCEFLAMELRLLNKEMGMDGNGYYSPCNTIAHDFHFPAGRSWESVPQPSTRAAMILRAVGIMPPVEGERIVYSLDLENALYDAKMRASILCDTLGRLFDNIQALEKMHGIELLRFMGMDAVNYMAHEVADSATKASAIYLDEVSA